MAVRSGAVLSSDRMLRSSTTCIVTAACSELSEPIRVRVRIRVTVRVTVRG